MASRFCVRRLFNFILFIYFVFVFVVVIVVRFYPDLLCRDVTHRLSGVSGSRGTSDVIFRTDVQPGFHRLGFPSRSGKLIYFIALYVHIIFFLYLWSEEALHTRYYRCKLLADGDVAAPASLPTNDRIGFPLVA